MTPSPTCEFGVANSISRNVIVKYENCRLLFVDFVLSMIFRTTSSRNTTGAASKPWTSRCQERFARFR